eukprot:GHRR01030738.1.p1 GENE.GHRR01030738.1~~GHRR01030738.1.p1  ORF type:complete len:100 (-),score=19.35 GHRR01030738.1:814-1113(-)
MGDQAFAYFDKDNDAALTIREMKDSVTAIFKERKNMSASLKVRLSSPKPDTCVTIEAEFSICVTLMAVNSPGHIAGTEQPQLFKLLASSCLGPHSLVIQ